MRIEEAREEIKREQKRIFPDARLVILEEFHRYSKVRLIISDVIFIEIRINYGNQRKSFVLVKNGKRIAGFDNLGGWHMHPCGRADAHKKISRPFSHLVFNYFVKCLKK